MGEVALETNYFEESPRDDHQPLKMIKTPERKIITINESSWSVTGSDSGGNGWSSKDHGHSPHQQPNTMKELPRRSNSVGGLINGRSSEDHGLDDGRLFLKVSDLLCSGIGFQALSLPVAFAFLGWKWGSTCLSAAFSWQLYTIWVFVQLSETFPEIRCGLKPWKLLASCIMMSVSLGSCVMLIITAGGNMDRLFIIICGGGPTCEDQSLPGVLWFLMFTCVAIAIAQLPNLSSKAVSVIGAITAVANCTLTWALSIMNGRPDHVSYDTAEMGRSDLDKFGNILNAIGIVVLALKGHNLALDTQGTLPSDDSKPPPSKTMWRGVTIAYLIKSMILLAVAICGFWAYGNQITTYGDMLNAFGHIHGHNTSKLVVGTIYLLAILSSLSSFPIYAMPVFDNLESWYVSAKGKQCSRAVRLSLRLFFGGLAFFIAVAFPFLGSLSPLFGGLTLPLTYAYPCFMYISIKKPSRNGGMWWLNWGLGCLGIILSVVLVVAAVWNLATKGLHANFFRP